MGLLWYIKCMQTNTFIGEFALAATHGENATAILAECSGVASAINDLAMQGV